jgi:hypothetical protein
MTDIQSLNAPDGNEQDRREDKPEPCGGSGCHCHCASQHGPCGCDCPRDPETGGLTDNE